MGKGQAERLEIESDVLGIPGLSTTAYALLFPPQPSTTHLPTRPELSRLLALGRDKVRWWGREGKRHGGYVHQERFSRQDLNLHHAAPS